MGLCHLGRGHWEADHPLTGRGTLGRAREGREEGALDKQAGLASSAYQPWRARVLPACACPGDLHSAQWPSPRSGGRPLEGQTVGGPLWVRCLQKCLLQSMYSMKIHHTQQGGDGSDGSGVRGPWVQRQTSPLAFGDVGRIHSLIQQELHEGLALGYNDKHHSQALPGLQTREGDENNHKQWSHCCKSR